jgi:hypothetical protein
MAFKLGFLYRFSLTRRGVFFLRRDGMRSMPAT